MRLAFACLSLLVATNPLETKGKDEQLPRAAEIVPTNEDFNFLWKTEGISWQAEGDTWEISADRKQMYSREGETAVVTAKLRGPFKVNFSGRPIVTIDGKVVQIQGSPIPLRIEYVGEAEVPDSEEHELRIEARNGQGVYNGIISRKPIITTQPEHHRFVEGERAVLSVGIGEQKGLSIQWRRNDIPIPSETETTLVIENADDNDGALYYAIVENEFGRTISEVAYLYSNGNINSALKLADFTWETDGVNDWIPIEVDRKVFVKSYVFSELSWFSTAIEGPFYISYQIKSSLGDGHLLIDGNPTESDTFVGEGSHVVRFEFTTDSRSQHPGYNAIIFKSATFSISKLKIYRQADFLKWLAVKQKESPSFKPDGDPDRDGKDNELEFFLGNDPFKAESNIRLVERVENGQRYLYVKFVYDDSLSNFKTGIEVSSDFINWTPIEAETTTEEIDGVKYKIFRLNSEILDADDEASFARIFVSG